MMGCRPTLLIGEAVTLCRCVMCQLDDIESEVVDMAMHLGLSSVTASSQLSDAQRWIIDKALEAPLPEGWSEHEDGQGRVYYFHATSQRSSWDHPMDEQFRGMVAATVGQRCSDESAYRTKLQATLSSALTPGSPRERASTTSVVPQRSGASVASGERSRGGEDAAGVVAAVREVGARRATAHTPDIISPILTLRSAAKVKEVMGVEEGRAAEVVRVAEALEISCMQEPGLLWIAEQGLDAPLPEGWRETTAGALSVYVHDGSGTVVNEHPLYPQLRKLAAKMRQEALVIKGKNKKHRTPQHRVGGSTHHRRQFSNSDGLEDSRKSLGDTFSSSGYSSDSWSDEEEDFEGTRVAEYRGKLWRRQKQETEPSVPEATAQPNLSEYFRRSDGLINRLGSTLQEAGHSAAKLTKSLSLDRPRTSLPVGVCNLGSLPKSRSSLVERGKQQQTSRSFSGRLPSIKRREDIYRIDSAMEEKGLREGIARMPMPSASSASGAKMIALPHFPPKADRAGGGGGQGPQLTRSQSRV